MCQKAFQNILRITRLRVEYISKNFAFVGISPCEKCGGDHKSIKFAAKWESVKKCISSLHCVELHYGTGPTARKYLVSELMLTSYSKFITFKFQ